MLETILLNGIDLDNNAMGSHLNDDAKPFAGVSPRVDTFTRAGRDGNIALPQSDESPFLVYGITVPHENVSALMMLLRAAKQTLTHRGLTAEAEPPSVSLSGTDIAQAQFTVTWRVPGMFWRDAEATTSPVALTTSGQVVRLMAGLTAPVRDSKIRIHGGLTGVVVQDSSGSAFQYTGVIPAASWLVYDTATGKAFLTSIDQWDTGVDVSLQTNSNSSTYYLQLTPQFTDPMFRDVGLTVSWSARTGSPTIEVRGRRAYRI